MPFITQGKTNLKYILIVVILAAIVGGGILGYSQWLIGKQEKKLTEFPELKISPGSKDNITNWKTYFAQEVNANLGLNFSIKYPSDWFVFIPQHQTPNIDVVISEKNISEPYQENSPCLRVFPGIWGSSTLKEVIQMNDSGAVIINGEEIYDEVQVKSEPTIIDGQDAVKRVVRKRDYSKDTLQAFVKKGEYAFKFDACADMPEKTFNQMLSTFRFLEKNLSEEEAINLVKNRSEVKEWLANFPGPNNTNPNTGGEAKIDMDRREGNDYIVHVYESLPTNNATFNWYRVNSETGVVIPEF